MSVIVSANSREKVYHYGGCCCERKIRESNKIKLDLDEARAQGYRRCKCCKTRERHIPIEHGFHVNMGHIPNLEYRYDTHSDTFYFRTDSGFWKAFWRDGYVLYHRNTYIDKLSFDKLKYGNVFHRQEDVRMGTSLGKMVNYLVAHDKAMKVIDVDYRKLPQTTRREQEYFKKARSISKKRSLRRLDNLLDQISGGKVNYALSAW